ncbi:MAG: ABC transporter permease [Acidobacteria bacterium RIFCSPLOWO2_02_FULL_68_18]|nr:MAG: ABC transporter permease [Acidobacteria bacterium RIFCSPLOWO2_02_FULL_68_18]OFW49764.1 MAG: ABC transporter permease [Acidobacteria bacterium RIFCSPLOWO2_12_FULL_68_19]
MVLYLLAVGLTVTLGLMRFVNLAHGVFAMAGGYVTVTVMSRFGVPFLPGVAVAVVVVAGAGMALERTLYRRLYQAPILEQVLFSVGLIFISMAAARYFFGPLAQPIELPAWLSGPVGVGIGAFPAYRVFLIAVGALVACAIWIGIERSRFGASVRAAVDNRRMAEAVGIDVDRVFTVSFGLGTALAALGGGLGADLLPIYPGYPNDYLVYFLIVVAVAGFGNLRGAFFVALAFGIVDTTVRYFMPDLGRMLVLLLVMAVLFYRPHGFAPRTEA